MTQQRLAVVADLAEQPFPRVDLKSPLPPQIKFLTLGELWRFLARLGEWIQVQEALTRLRIGLARFLAYVRMTSAVTASPERANVPRSAVIWISTTMSIGTIFSSSWNRFSGPRAIPSTTSVPTLTRTAG